MNVPNIPPSSAGSGDAGATSEREGEVLVEDLDLEEDVAPNLGGEDQMQDA